MMIFNNPKKKFLKIKKQIQTRDGNNTWFYIELENVKNSITNNTGMNYSSRVEDKNIERLQQLVWWLEDERKQRGK